MVKKKCPCGGEIIFENKKTFTNPEEMNGICKKCKTQYKYVDKILIRKG